MLSLSQSITLFFKRIFSFTGRSSRAEFWWVILMYFVVSFVATFFYSMVDTFEFDRETMTKIQSISFVLSLLLIPVSVRRLHDLGWHGAWAILFYLPLVSVIMYIVAAFPSQHKTNEYGADPTADPMGHFDFYRQGLHERYGAYGLQSKFDQFFKSDNFREF